MALLDDAKNHQSTFSRTWDANLLAYRGLTKTEIDYEGYATLRVKYAFQTLEVIRANIVEPEPTFDFDLDGVPEEGEEDIIKALNLWLPKQNIWVEDDFVCGVNIAKYAWRQQVRTIAGREQVVHNRPTADTVDPRKFYADPQAKSSDDWAYAYHESELTVPQLRFMVDKGFYDKAVVDKMCSSGPLRDEMGRPKGYTVYEYWTVDVCQTFCDAGILNSRVNERGWIPFAISATLPMARSIYGMPEMALVKDPQEALQSLDDMGIEALKYAVRPVVGYRRDRVGSNEVISQMRPGGAIPFSTPQDLSVFWQGGPANLIMEKKRESIADLQNVTGASPYLQGGQGGQYGVNNHTATGMNIMEAGASKRMRLRMMNLTEFYSDMVMRGFIEQGYMFGDLDVDPATVSHASPKWLNRGTNEEAEMQGYQALFNTLAPLALQQYRFADGSVLNLRPLVEEMIRIRRWDAKKFFSTAPGDSVGAPNPYALQDVIAMERASNYAA